MKKRLQSVARYESFHPQALACSVPLQDVEYTTDSNTFLNSDRHSPSTSPQRWRRFASLPESPRIARPQTSASLGAVAGSDGVAIFRISQPQMPLMILSHASTSFTTTEASPAITSLAFSTGASRSSLYLASARGSGALIWDVSGHSLSPLQGRLGVEDSSDHSSITSLAWIKKGTRLAATTAASACIWDLRDSHSYRPSLRFGITNTSGQHGTIFPDIPSYRQITCSDQAEECAVLDSAGTVRIFDTRMTDRVTRRSMGSLCQFDAFDFAGVGLCFLPTTQGDGKSWVTWGLDAPNSNAVVKVWMKSADNVSPVKEDSTPDNYWYLDTSPARQKSRKTFLSTKNESTSYCLVGKCTTSNLACARVCPEPVEDAIVTVGLQNGTGASWQAELWALRVNVATDDDSVKESKLERIISFQSSNGADECLDAVGGSDPSMFNLRASELAVSSYSGSFSKTNNYGLLLCCLTDNGYVITHVSVAKAPTCAFCRVLSLAPNPSLLSLAPLMYLSHSVPGNS